MTAADELRHLADRWRAAAKIMRDAEWADDPSARYRDRLHAMDVRESTKDVLRGMSLDRVMDGIEELTRP